jgi:6-phosphogluconolactonase (cycloisomerase 2 family)
LLATLVAVPASAALAAGPLGSLSQLPSPNNCIGTTPECGTASTSSLAESQSVVVSPDGKNVYMAEFGDASISEFARHSDGSLTQLASPNNCIAQTASTSTCGTKTANGLEFAEAIAISPDGRNVYAVGEDSNSVGAIAEFARNADGSLTQLASPNNCIGENPTQTDGTMSTCGTGGGHGLFNPVAVTVSPDGTTVYVADRAGSAIAEFARSANGSLTQLSGANDCVQEHGVNNGFGPDCTTSGNGLSGAESLAVSPDGHSVYVGGGDSIAEFTRNANGSLTQVTSPNNCIQNHADTQTDCGNEAGIGLRNLVSLDVSPDGQNLYSSAGNYTGAVAEFARSADGSLAQLSGANSCIEENAANEGTQAPAGCGTRTGNGLGEGGALEVSPDGANVYVAESSDDCNSTCHSAVVELSRRADGSLVQLASPNNCIEEGGADCGTESGHGLSTNVLAGLAIAPGADSVYTGGETSIAEFARVLPTLTVSLSGSGTGNVSDGTGAISCSPTCSHAYPIGAVVTLTATQASGSGFTGWSGSGCSGTSTCQVVMSANTAVTATFVLQSPPTSVLTTQPPSVTATGAAFSGSANPNGLPTTAVFQYGLDLKYTTPGASGPNYTQSTPAQFVGSDFASHIVSTSVSGLVPNALYHVRLVVTNADGTIFGPDVTFTTGAGPKPGSPTPGKTFNVSVVSGLVLVEINGQLVPLTELTQIPKNTLIDALQGTIQLTTALPGASSARDAAAKGKKHKTKTQTGTFGGAIFKISQVTRGAGKGLVTLAIVENAFKGAPSYSLCTKHKAADPSATVASSRTLQLLRASAHGKFRTSGRYSAATVLGTKWSVADRCDGTLTHDITDSVVVNDFVHHKEIVLHASQSYLAKAPKHK